MQPSQILSVLFPQLGAVDAFIGCVLLAVVVVGVAAAWHGPLRRETRLLTGIAIGTYLYSLGPFNVFHGILYSLVPMMDKARSANLAFVTSSFAIAVLGAMGIDALRNHRDSILSWARRCEYGLLALAIVVGAFIFLSATLKLPFIVDPNGLMMVAVIAASGAGLFHVYRSDHLSPHTCIFLLMALAFLEWAVPGHYFIQPREQASYVPQLEKYKRIANFLKTRPEPVRVHAAQELIPYNFGDWHGIDQRQGYLASVSMDVFDLVIGRGEARSLLGVNYVVAKAPETPGQTEVFSGEQGLHVYQDPSAFPRVWTVHSAVSAPDQAAMDRQFAAGADSWRRQAFVAEPAPKLSSCDVSDSTALESTGTQSVRIRAVMGCTGMLIFSDAFFPGWRATVDGKPAKIYRAYEALRGIVVPAGSHVVSMSYRPTAFYVGVALTLIGLILAALSCLRRYLKPS